MALKEVNYGDGSGGNSVKMTHCPMCGDDLCRSSWVSHIEDKPECRETALSRLEELSSGTHRRDIEDSHNERDGSQDESGTVQVTL